MDETLKRHQGYTVHHTGHSKGGAIAQLFSAGYGVRSVTFDAPPVRDIAARLFTGLDVSNLPITSYLSAPNCVNSIGRHLSPNIKYLNFSKELHGLGFPGYIGYSHEQHKIEHFSKQLAAGIKVQEVKNWPSTLPDAYFSYRLHSDFHSSFRELYIADEWQKVKHLTRHLGSQKQEEIRKQFVELFLAKEFSKKIEGQGDETLSSYVHKLIGKFKAHVEKSLQKLKEKMEKEFNKETEKETSSAQSQYDALKQQLTDKINSELNAAREKGQAEADEILKMRGAQVQYELDRDASRGLGGGAVTVTNSDVVATKNAELASLKKQLEATAQAELDRFKQQLEAKTKEKVHSREIVANKELHQKEAYVNQNFQELIKTINEASSKGELSPAEALTTVMNFVGQAHELLGDQVDESIADLLA